MKDGNQKTERAVCVKLSPGDRRVLEEYLDLDPNDPASSSRLQALINGTLRYRRGLTVEQFVKLYDEQQERKCAICRRRPPRSRKKKFEFDHDHNKPYLIRGLLCIRCNTELEYYDKFGQRIKEYLEHPPAQQAGLEIPFTRNFWSKRQPPSSETIGRLQDMLRRGTTLKELCSIKAGLPAATLRSYVTRRLLQFPDDTIERTRTHLASGMPQPQIAEAVGVYESTLKWIMRTYDLRVKS